MVRAIIAFLLLVLSLSFSDAQEGARLAVLIGNQSLVRSLHYLSPTIFELGGSAWVL